MNVLFLCGGYRSNYKGNFIPSLEILEKKLLPGRSIYVFHTTNAKYKWCNELEKRGAIVEYIDFSVPLFKRVMIIMQLLRKHSIDIIHVHFGEKVTATLCGYMMPKVKVVWHIHSDWSLGKKQAWTINSFLKEIKHKLINLLGHRAVKLAVSKNLAEHVGGIYAPNGLAVDRVYQVSDKGELRKSLGLEENSIVVLCFGWSPEVKGVDIAVNAITILRKKADIDIQLMLVTGQDDENVRKWLDAKTACGSKASFVHYCPPIEDVFLYHNVADVFLSASRSEGFSYAVCEALSIAKPCVCSDIPGLNWAKEYTSITFFPSESVELCASEMYKVILGRANKEEIEQRAIDAANFVKEYSAEKWADSVIEAYNGK